MSKALLVLLGREHDKKLAVALRDLETSAPAYTVDAKIIGDILHAGYLAVREMGLDRDVTSKELYHALRVNDDVLSKNTEYVGLHIEGETISFHPSDIARDAAESRQFSDRSLLYFRRALSDELIRRYRECVVRPSVIEHFVQCLEKGEKK